MKTILEAPRSKTLPQRETVRDRPDPDWCRGRCPSCGEEVVSNCYYIGGKGYQIIFECWASLGDDPSCDYRRVL